MATTTTGYFKQLGLESLPLTHCAVITKAELTDTTSASVQTIAYNLPAGTRVYDVVMDLITPFTDDGAATTSVTASVKDNAGTPIVFIAAKELNSAGSYITLSAMDDSTIVSQVYNSAAVINIAFTPTGGALSALDRGEVRVYFSIQSHGRLG